MSPEPMSPEPMSPESMGTGSMNTGSTAAGPDLTGRVALVTGATSGLGRHFAELLAGHGAAVAVAGRRAERASEVVDAIEGAGGRALAVQLDVRDAGAIGQV